MLPATGDTTTVTVQVNPPAPVNLALNTSGAAFPKATATFTGQYDSTAAVLDGVVSSRRWTNWDPNAWRPADTLTVDLGSARTVSSVRLDFFDDQGGTRPPATADLQRQDPATGEWVSLTGGPTAVTDGQVVLQKAYAGQLQRVRVVMTARPGTCIAVSEFSVFGPGASDGPVPRHRRHPGVAVGGREARSRASNRPRCRTRWTSRATRFRWSPPWPATPSLR